MCFFGEVQERTRMDEKEIFEKKCRRCRDPHRLHVDNHFFATVVSNTDAAWMVNTRELTLPYVPTCDGG
jgi:hypothetical protein